MAQVARRPDEVGGTSTKAEKIKATIQKKADEVRQAQKKASSNSGTADSLVQAAVQRVQAGTSAAEVNSQANAYQRAYEELKGAQRSVDTHTKSLVAKGAGGIGTAAGLMIGNIAAQRAATTPQALQRFQVEQPKIDAAYDRQLSDYNKNAQRLSGALRELDRKKQDVSTQGDYYTRLLSAYTGQLADLSPKARKDYESVEKANRQATLDYYDQQIRQIDQELAGLSQYTPSYIGGQMGNGADYQQVRQRAQQLQAQRSRITQEMETVKLQEITDRWYMQYAGMADWAERSAYKPQKIDTSVESFLGVDASDALTYEVINGNDQARNKAIYQQGMSGSAMYGDDYSYLYRLTEKEKKTYNYLYSLDQEKGGRRAAAYLAELRPLLNQRARQETEAKMRTLAQEDPVGASISSVVTGPMKAGTYVMQAASLLNGGIDQNAGYNRWSYGNSAVRGQVSKMVEEHWGKVGSFLYQTGMSMADFLYNFAITGGSAGSENLVLALMGTEAAADTVVEAKDRGLDDAQAFTLGTIAGAAEILTEKVSLETLLDKSSLSRNALGYWLKNVLAEGSEEVASDLINLVADNLISQDKSEWNMAIRAYMEQGLSEDEAFVRAFADKAASVALSGLGGAVSGGVMGAGGVALNGIATRNYNQARNTPEGRATLAIEAGEEYLAAAEEYGENSQQARAALQNFQSLVELAENANAVSEKLSQVEPVVQQEQRQKPAIQYSISDKLAEDLKAVRENTFQASKGEVYIGETSDFLTQAIGAKALSVTMPANKVYSAMVTEAEAKADGRYDPNVNYHGLGERGLIDVLDSAEKPVAAFVDTHSEKGSRADRIVLVTDRPMHGGLAVVITEVNSRAIRDGKRIPVNKDITVYDRTDVVADILSADREGRLLHLERKEAGKLLGYTGANSLAAIQTSDFNDNIRHFWENVNWKKTGQTVQTFGKVDGQTEMAAALEKAGYTRQSAFAASPNKQSYFSASEAGQLLERLAKATGVQLSTEGTFRAGEAGYYDRAAGTLHVNPKADSRQQLAAVFTHELTHHLESTQSYGKLRDMLVNRWKADHSLYDRILKKIQDYGQHGVRLNREAAIDEMVAEYAQEHLFTDAGEIRSLAAYDLSLAGRIKNWLGRLAAKITGDGERQFLLAAERLYTQAIREVGKTTTKEEHHSPEMLKIMQEYQDAVDPELRRYLEDARNGKVPWWQKYYLKDVDDRAAKDIKALTGLDPTGFRTVFDLSSAEHIEKRHGTNGKANHSMADLDDVARIQYVLDNYDKIEIGTRTTTKARNTDGSLAKTVLYSKRVDGTYYVVEAVPDSRRQEVNIVSAYMTKADATGQAQSGKTGAAPVASGGSASTNSIPDSSENSNPQTEEKTGRQYSLTAEQKISQVRENTFENAPSIFTQADLAAREMAKEGFAYEVKTEQATMREAQARLEKDYEGERERLPELESWGSADLDTAMGILQRVNREARESGDFSKVAEWAKLIQEKGTSAGQMIQAFAKYSRTPEGVLTTAARNLQALVKDRRITDDQMNDILRDMAEFTETLDAIQEGDRQSLADLIVRQAKRRKTKVSRGTLRRLNAEPDFQYLFDFALTQLENIAADFEPRSAGKKLGTYQTIAHLFNLRTGMRNVVSNQVFDLIDSATNNLSLLPDAILSAVSGRRTVGLNKSWLSSEKRKGAAQGFRRGALEASLDVEPHSSDGKSKYGTGGRRTWTANSRNPLARGMSTVEKAMGYELNVTDEFHKGSVRGETLESLRKLVEKGDLTLEDAERMAQEEALYRSFQDQTLMGSLLAGLKQVGNLVGIGDSGKRLKGAIVHEFGLGDFIQKYTQVPGALIHRAVEFSPTGYVKAIALLAKAHKRGGLGNNPMIQRKAAQAIGRATTGTGLITAFAALAAAGILRWAKGEEDKNVAALNSAEGVGGVQLNYTAIVRWLHGESTEWQSGDVVFDLDFLEPINAQMTLGTMIAQDESTDGYLLKLAKHTPEALFKALKETPTLQTINTVYQTMQYHDDETDLPLWAEIPITVAESSITGFVPSVVRQIAQATDMNYRDMYSSQNPLQQIGDKMKNTIPGLRQTLPEKLDNFGQPKTYSNPWLNAFNAVAFPGNMNIYKQGEVSKELEAVRKETGRVEFYPERNAPYALELSGEKLILTPEERDTFQRTRGALIDATMQDLMQSKVYQTAGAGEKADLLKAAKDFGNDLAKRELAANRGIEYKTTTWDKTLEAMENGVSFGDYQAWKQGDMTIQSLQEADIPDGAKSELYRMDISDSQETDKRMQAVKEAGLTTDDFLAITRRYNEIMGEDGKKSTEEKVGFANWLDQQSYTQAQKDAILPTYIPKTDIQRYEQLKNAGLSITKASTIAKETADMEKEDAKAAIAFSEKYTTGEKAAALGLMLSDREMTALWAAQSAGVSLEDYMDVVLADLSSDKDANGDAIKGREKKNKVLTYIDTIPGISIQQKDALASALYADSTINSYAPWWGGTRYDGILPDHRSTVHGTGSASSAPTESKTKTSPNDVAMKLIQQTKEKAVSNKEAEPQSKTNSEKSSGSNEGGSKRIGSTATNKVLRNVVNTAAPAVTGSLKAKGAVSSPSAPSSAKKIILPSLTKTKTKKQSLKITLPKKLTRTVVGGKGSSYKPMTSSEAYLKAYKDALKKL